VLTLFLAGGIPGVTPYASGRHIWGRCLELFEGKVQAVDLEGATVEEMVRNVMAKLDSFDVGTCALVGHDLGGLVALGLGSEFPQKIKSVTAVAAVPAAPTGDGVPNLTFAHPPKPLWGRESQRWALERVSYSHQHIDDQLLDACVRAAERAREASAQFMQSLMAAKSRFYAACREGGYPVPAQVLWGTHDPLASLEHGLWLYRMIAAKQAAAQFHAVNRAGSLPFREEPQAFHQIVAAFLEST
jgi:pimeloyl-ACP methyl ester carboxylesterase